MSNPKAPAAVVTHAGAPRGIAARIDELADGIARYLHGVVAREGMLPARSFYGESFAALLLARAGADYGPSVSRLMEAYRRKDAEAPEFHWEFNKYAWLTLLRETNDPRARELALPLRFRNTKVTNWTLLRACTRLLADRGHVSARDEARSVLRRFQARSGLICDQPNVRSFQYHCFSAVLAMEISDLGGGAEFLRSFHRAAEFIEPFVLETGDALYVGRGQQQSFGYGALVYLLASAAARFGESRYISALERCVGFLECAARSDGSFPMVLNGREQGFPPGAAHADRRFPGWYAYNNYFDYLPFLGVFLRKAADAVRAIPLPERPAPVRRGDRRDATFLIHRGEAYEAVVGRPGGGLRGRDGYWTNDLPVPYVVSGGERLTPSYGGEQFGSPLYSGAGIPLPAVERRGRRVLLRDARLWSFLLGDRLVVLTGRGALLRRFRFLDREIRIDDLHLGPGRFHARYLLDGATRLDDQTYRVGKRGKVVFSEPMDDEGGDEYFWGGELRALVSRGPGRRFGVRIVIEDECDQG